MKNVYTNLGNPIGGAVRDQKLRDVRTLAVEPNHR